MESDIYGMQSEKEANRKDHNIAMLPHFSDIRYKNINRLRINFKEFSKCES